jgi:ubiquinone/menaquinone biosynthesis C-methylase UbiE
MTRLQKDSHYLHGTAPAEQDRLSRLNDLLNELSLREMALRAGEKSLDVGSGLGQLTHGMARQVGGALVVGVERSEAQLAEARRLAAETGEAGAVEFRQGDATHLPLRDEEWGTFDVAHARFVLEHVTDPLAVVREMTASTTSSSCGGFAVGITT